MDNDIDFPDYAIHPVAELFPAMTADEFTSLVAGMRRDGWQPGSVIWTHGGQIIDGRNRYLAAREAGVMPEFREWSGGGSLIQFVVSLNLTRRHLTSSQRAVLALEIAKGLETEAKARQLAGLKKGTDVPVPQTFAERADADEEGENEDWDKEEAFKAILGDEETLPQKFAEASGADGEGENRESDQVRGETAEIAARMVGTNKQYVKDAARIEAARPDLIPEVAAGLLLAELPAVASQQETHREEEEEYEGDLGRYAALVIDVDDTVNFIEEVEALKTARNCWVLVWHPADEIEDLIEVMGSAGFNYVNCLFVWAALTPLGAARKGDYTGMNGILNWHVANTVVGKNAVEFCWGFRRGDPPQRAVDAPLDVIVAPLNEQADQGRLPLEFRRRIVAWIDGEIKWL